jgi:diguanylate cyclase (GGDEF)-like protein
MLGMVWFGIWYQIHGEYRNAEQSAHRDLQNYSRVFEEHINRTVRELDKALLIARKRYLQAREELPYEAAIGLKLPDPALLSDMSFQMATIDREGILTATTIGEHPPKPIDLKDREHYQVHKSARPDTPHISKPVLGRRSGRWSVQLSRRIEGPDRRFDGVLLASMDPEHFGRFYGSIDFGHQDAVIFAGRDGVVRVASGSETLKLGDSISKGHLMNAAEKGSGVYRGDMDGSGTERMFALRHMDDHPLFVAVGTSPSTIFAAADKNRTRYIAAGAGVTLLILLAIAASLRHHQTVARMARYDDLTGLANRACFREAMEAANTDLQKGRKVGLILLDIDNFKNSNDTFGHMFGDKILIAVGKRLTKVTRSTDMLARLAGDEFAFLLTDFKKDGMLATRAEEMLDAIRRPMIIDGQRLNITVSIGSAIATSADAPPDRLFKNADLALYEAKRRGRNCHRSFQVEMAERFAQRRRLEEDLGRALEHDQLEVFYQPVHSLDSDNITGFEALLRWNHPNNGWIQPVDFIPIAEDSRLIIPIGDWVLNEACKAAKDFAPSKQIAVNLSPVQFMDHDLFSKITSALQRSGLPPERLELEITESLMMDASTETIDTLRRIRALGVKIAMDDFGTGYSSLGYLCNFEFDRIKIDRSFIMGLDQHSNYAAVIRTIITLAKSLGVQTTAEGIETLQQLEMIRAMGCTEAQGYLFSPPMPLKKLRHLTNPVSGTRPKRLQNGEAGTEPGDYPGSHIKAVKTAMRDVG